MGTSRLFCVDDRKGVLYLLFFPGDPVGLIHSAEDAGVEYVPSEQQEQLWFISWVEYLRQEHGMQIQVMRDGFNGVYFWWLQYKPNAVPLVLEPALNYGDLLGNSTCYGIWLAISVRCFSCFATWKGKSNSNCKNIVAIFFGLVLYEPRTNLCNRTIYIYIYMT